MTKHASAISAACSVVLFQPMIGSVFDLSQMFLSAAPPISDTLLSAVWLIESLYLVLYS